MSCSLEADGHTIAVEPVLVTAAEGLPRLGLTADLCVHAATARVL